jgi:hypothetical protein
MAHLIGVNICIWFKSILQETFESAKQNNRPHTGFQSINFYRQLNTLSVYDYRNLTLRQHQPVSIIQKNKTSISNSTSLPNDESSCLQTSFQVTNMLDKLSSFLHPCTIEYSIICVTLLYEIWHNIGNIKATSYRRYSIAAAQTQIYYIDCNKAMKGLFSGILVFLLNIIILILFIVSDAGFGFNPETQSTSLSSMNSSKNESSNHNSMNSYTFQILTIYLTEALELFMLILSLAVTANVFRKLKKLGNIRFKENFSISLEEVSEMFALLGVMSFSVFRILAFRFMVQKSVYSYLLLANAILSFIQGLVQTLFIMEGLKKKSNAEYGIIKKIGREQITFLIVTNISLWLFYTVTRNKYTSILFKDSPQGIQNQSFSKPLYESEYLDLRSNYIFLNQSFSNDFQYSQFSNYLITNSSGLGRDLGHIRARISFLSDNENAQAVKWIMINTISYPLLLYYHFHSSSCLSNMWKDCYSDL